jgi:glutathione S-transferase
MTRIELYHTPGSLCSQKVKLVLAEKQIEWKSHLINLLTFENLKPDYMRLNPKGVVPTLIHNDKVICDSVTIIHYLDTQFPNPILTPVISEQQDKMNSWIDLQNRFPMREVMYGNMAGIDGLVVRRSVQVKEKLLPKLMQASPQLQEHYALKLKDVQQWNQTIQDAEKITHINAKIEPMLDQLDQQLSQSEWLCGSSYSLADVVWTAVLNRLAELKFDSFWTGGKRSAIAAYLQRLKNRPSFKVAIQTDTMPALMILSGLRRLFLGI